MTEDYKGQGESYRKTKNKKARMFFSSGKVVCLSNIHYNCGIDLEKKYCIINIIDEIICN